jgi:hypothetical protein
VHDGERGIHDQPIRRQELSEKTSEVSTESK